MLTAAAAQKNTEQLTVSRERGRRGTERAGEEAKDNGRLTTALKTGGKRRVQTAEVIKARVSRLTTQIMKL